MRNRIIIVISAVFLLALSFQMNTENKIREAINYQMEHYPQSTLRDTYKNFFQDFYGPGHLLENPNAAINYLHMELEQVKECSLYKPVESTGYKNNFVRVDLCLIKNNTISADSFVSIFLESARSFLIPEIEEWKGEWQKILSVIDDMENKPKNYEEDKQALSEMLSQNKYVVHHSEKFIEAYHPHYRIIRRDLLEESGLKGL